jgi:hypothetical protein
MERRTGLLCVLMASEMPPEDEQPEVSPLLRPLLRAPCRKCQKRELRPRVGHYTQTPDLPADEPVPDPREYVFPQLGESHAGEPPDGANVGTRFVVTVRCDNCGWEEERHGWQERSS